MPEDSGSTSKKILGLSPVSWLIIGGGGVVTYIVYERYKADQASSAANALSGGTTIPSVEASGSSTPSAPTSLAQWIQQAIANMTNAQYGTAAALNDINSWLAGNCVTQTGYNAIGGLVETLGLPPGYNTVPSLSVCPNGGTGGGSSTGTTTSTSGGATTGTTGNPPTAASNSSFNPDFIPALPAAIAAAMTNNGEHIIASFADAATQTYVYVTQKGGVYTLGSNGQAGGTFYGSFLGLPAADRESTASFVSANANPDGSYTLTNSLGQTYNFSPATAKLENVPGY